MEGHELGHKLFSWNQQSEMCVKNNSTTQTNYYQMETSFSTVEKEFESCHIILVTLKYFNIYGWHCFNSDLPACACTMIWKSKRKKVGHNLKLRLQIYQVICILSVPATNYMEDKSYYSWNYCG